MKELLNELGISLSAIQTKEDLSNSFKRIADKLFEEYEVSCGEHHFHFAEIEFYYYRKGTFDDEWNMITYDRNDKKDGDFFYHYSGVDICFESNYSDDFAEFGGILIRCLYTIGKDGKKKLIFGPLACKDEILNSCKSEMPQLCRTNEKVECDVECTKLAGVRIENQSNNCFYDSNIANDEWVREITRYDVRKQKTRPYISKYNTGRFSLKGQ